MISWSVVGHEQRLLEATALAKSVGGVLALDDGIGADRNHLLAWELTATRESEWCATLEDDAQPIPGFLLQAEQALTAAPEPLVSFYLGTTRPRRWQERIPSAIARADNKGAHWLSTTHTIHAVALAMHTNLREDWLDWAPASTLPIDERMSAWCMARGHRVAYTWPSLVDHADGDTLINHRDGRPRNAPRKAWRTGTRLDWHSRSVPL